MRGAGGHDPTMVEPRLGALRVYYAVEAGDRVVNVLAVGRKERDRVVIGGEEIEL